MSRLVIKSHRPWQTAIAIMALSMLVSALTWFLLDSNHWTVIYKRLTGNTTVKEMMETNQGLQAKNRQLHERLLMLQQTTKLDQETAVLMQDELKSLQDEIYQLKRELEFYQGVMDTTRTVTGLEIHGIYVEPLPKAGEYQIKLILTNVVRNDRILTGKLGVWIEGTDSKGRKRLDLNNLLIDERSSLAFELKSFKRVECRFQLSSAFSPERVIVEVNVNGGNKAPINRTYDWPLD